MSRPNPTAPRYREPGAIGSLRTAVRVLADLVGAYRHMPNMTEFSDGSVWLKLRDSHSMPTPRMNLPEANHFLESDSGREYRGEVAMELMDPNVYGVMLFLLKRGEDGVAEIEFRAQTAGTWVRAFTYAFARVIEGVEGMRHE